MLLVGQRDLWNVSPEDMQRLFYQQMLGNNWPATEKMLLLIQLPTLANEEAVHALFYLMSEYRICQNKDAKNELWGECFSLYKPLLWLEKKTLWQMLPR